MKSTLFVTAILASNFASALSNPAICKPFPNTQALILKQYSQISRPVGQTSTLGVPLKCKYDRQDYSFFWLNIKTQIPVVLQAVQSGQLLQITHSGGGYGFVADEVEILK